MGKRLFPNISPCNGNLNKTPVRFMSFCHVCHCGNYHLLVMFVEKVA